MKIYLDTANLDEIRQGMSLGIVNGVTTNPSLMAREGIKGKENIRKHYETICKIVAPGEVSAEVIATDYEGMIAEGRELAQIAPNIVVKIPCTEDGLRAICTLSDEEIDTNCTLIFSLGQAILAAKAGATYVSPFLGRLDDIGEDGLEAVEDICSVLDQYCFDTEVIAASIRSTNHIIQCMRLGVDIATCPLKTVLPLIKHPLTDKGLAKFLEDYHKLND